MNDLKTRAAAIRGLIDSRTTAESPVLFVQAIASCCEGLYEQGEAGLVLDLIEHAEGIIIKSTADWRITFTRLRAQAMCVRGQASAALLLVRTTLAEDRNELRLLANERRQLQICEGSCLWRLNRISEAVDALMAVRSELLSAPDSPLLASCVLQLSNAELMRGDKRRARRFALEAMVTAQRCANTYFEALAFSNMGRIERWMCRWASSVEATSEALGLFEVAGHALFANIERRGLAITSWKRGQIAEASKLAMRCSKEAAEIGNDLHSWFGTLLQGMILLHMGEYDHARSLFTSDRRWELPEQLSRPSLLTVEFLGDVHLEQGDGASALKLYDEVFPQAMALVPKGDIVAELRRRRAECYYLLGRFEEAYEEARTGLEHCREMGDRYEEAATYRVLALSAGALGKPAEARQWFEQGFAYYDDIETPFEWGKLWMSYGDWLLSPHAGEYASRDTAMDAYRAAIDHFESMGSKAKLELARQKLEAILPKKPSSGDPTQSTKDRPRRRPTRETELLRRSEWAFETFRLLTRSRTILDLLDDVAKLARTDSPILVLGESGTGKELIASGVHSVSGRPGQYIPINSATIPKEMFESELFGHVAGAFTGATRDKAGLFESANNGTVFLDEIAEMPIDLQSRLLRFLETGETRRIGSNHNLSVTTRLIAATNRQRTGLERGDGFRTDLYYRLAHAVVVLPPLRQRGEEDLDILIDHLLEEFSRQERKTVRLSEAARLRMLEYAWPGNVRQMRSTIRRAVILTPQGGEIQEHQLQLADDKAPSSLLEELEGAERGRIATALEQSRGSRAEAARALGMKRTTLLNKMRRHGLR